jgi:hypothetical protein
MSADATSLTCDQRVYEPNKGSGFWNLRLLIATVVAFVGHVFCFYVFQVQDAKVVPALPITTDVIYLSQQDPLTKAVLRQLDDYYSAFDGALAPGSSLAPLLPMAEEVSDGHNRFYVEMMPSPFLEEEKPDMSVLPELPKVEALTEINQLTYSLSLRHRALSLELPEAFSAAPNSWRVAITPAGQVHHVFPLDGRPPTEQMVLVQQAIHRLRFQAAPSLQHLEWGTITVNFAP